MLLNGETSASYSTARAGVPYRLQSSFGPFTPTSSPSVLGCVLLAICVLVWLKRQKDKKQEGIAGIKTDSQTRPAWAEWHPLPDTSASHPKAPIDGSASGSFQRRPPSAGGGVVVRALVEKQRVSSSNATKPWAKPSGHVEHIGPGRRLAPPGGVLAEGGRGRAAMSTTTSRARPWAYAHQLGLGVGRALKVQAAQHGARLRATDWLSCTQSWRGRPRPEPSVRALKDSKKHPPVVAENTRVVNSRSGRRWGNLITCITAKVKGWGGWYSLSRSRKRTYMLSASEASRLRNAIQSSDLLRRQRYFDCVQHYRSFSSNALLLPRPDRWPRLLGTCSVPAAHRTWFRPGSGCSGPCRAGRHRSGAAFAAAWRPGRRPLRTWQR